jgi:hypothetical protein
MGLKSLAGWLAGWLAIVAVMPGLQCLSVKYGKWVRQAWGYIYIGHPLGQIMSLQQARQTLRQQNMVFSYCSRAWLKTHVLR